MVAFNKFYPFVALLHNGGYTLSSDTIKVMLSNTAPTTSNAVKSDITEISAGNGYAAGGTALSGVTSTQTGGTYTLNSANLTVVTATGAVGPFRYPVLYDATTNNLLGYYDNGSSITLVNTETFTLTFSGGIFTCV